MGMWKVRFFVKCSSSVGLFGWVSFVVVGVLFLRLANQWH